MIASTRRARKRKNVRADAVCSVVLSSRCSCAIPSRIVARLVAEVVHDDADDKPEHHRARPSLFSRATRRPGRSNPRLPSQIRLESRQVSLTTLTAGLRLAPELPSVLHFYGAARSLSPRPRTTSRQGTPMPFTRTRYALLAVAFVAAAPLAFAQTAPLAPRDVPARSIPVPTTVSPELQ
jgi:hypothetical protein